jgi:hypothetical protein
MNKQLKNAVFDKILYLTNQKNLSVSFSKELTNIGAWRERGFLCESAACENVVRSVFTRSLFFFTYYTPVRRRVRSGARGRKSAAGMFLRGLCSIPQSLRSILQGLCSILQNLCSILRGLCDILHDLRSILQGLRDILQGLRSILQNPRNLSDDFSKTLYISLIIHFKTGGYYARF